jgi:CrcB protein
MTAIDVMWVGLGGGIGSLLRWWIGLGVGKIYKGNFPSALF